MVRDYIRRMEAAAGTAVRLNYVSHAGDGGRRWIQFIYKPVTGNTAIRSDCD